MDQSALSETERAIHRAFADGRELDLTGSPDPVPARWLVDLLAGLSRPARTGIPALRLAGARVRGPLELCGADVDVLAAFTDCAFDSPIDLRSAGVVGLELARCELPGLRAAGLRARNDLVFNECTVRGTVELTDARVDGSLRLTGCHTGGAGGVAVAGDRLTVAGALDARWMRASGEVRLPGARVQGNVDLQAATLRNPGADALDGRGLQVNGSLRADDGFDADGRVVLAGASVSGDVVFTGATLHAAPSGDGGPVLVLPRGQADTSASLLADRITVRGNVELDGGLTTTGPVRLPHANVGGYLRLSGATLGRPDADGGDAVPVALLADGIEVSGDLEARGDAGDGSALRAFGQVRLVDATVHGSASLSGSVLCAPGLDVLFADRLRIGGTLFLRRVRASGSVRLQNATIGSTVDCTGAELDAPRVRPDGSIKPSLDARVAEIGKDLLCSRGFTATGGVRLRGAEVTKSVNLGGAVLGGEAEQVIALHAHGLVCQELVLRPARPPRGDVRLTKATTGTLFDNAELWQSTGVLDLEDFRYDSLTASPDVDVVTRLRWLRAALRGYDPDPYDQLAASYRDSGHDDLADSVLLAKQRQRHRSMSAPGRVWGWLQELTVGYGYRPWLAAIWLAVFWLAGSIWFGLHRLPKLDADQNPVWNPVLYAADLLIPIVPLGQEGLWRISGASAWVAGALTIVGWTLASTAATGATRVLTRNR